jgi:hypothetical protein
MNRMSDLHAAFDKDASLCGDTKMRFPYCTQWEDIGALHGELFVNYSMLLVTTYR